MADIFSGLLGAGANIYGMLQGAHQQQWQNDYMINLLNNARAQQQYGLERWQDNGNIARDQALGLLNPLSAMAWQQNGGYMPALNDQLMGQQNNIMDIFRNSGQYMTPDMMGSQQGLQDVYNQLGGLGQTATNVFNGGGWSQPGSQLLDRGIDMVQGQGSQMGALGDVGTSLLGQRGQSAYTQGLQDIGMRNLQNGGMSNPLQAAAQGGYDLIGNQGSTPYSQSGINSALGLTENRGWSPELAGLMNTGNQTLQGQYGIGGLTPTGAAGEGVALQGLLDQGGTDTTDFLQGRGADLAGRESLLPMSQVMSMARDQAATFMGQQAEAFRRQALARGGGPGATVANGAQNQALADFANEGGQAEAKAMRDALMAQQGLQLQQAGMGAQMAQQGGALQNQGLQTYGNLLQNLEGTANQRFGIGSSMSQGAAGLANQAQNTGYSGLEGLGGLETQRLLGGMNIQPGVQNAATGLMGTAGQLGLGAGNLENSNMNTGANMLNNYNQSRLNALGQSNNILTGMNQYGLGAGQLAGNIGAQQGQLQNNQFNNFLNAGQLGVNRANMISGQMNQNLGNMVGFGNLLNNSFNSGMSPLVSLAGMGASYAGQGLGAAGGTNPGAYGQNPWAGLGSMAQGLSQVPWGQIMGNGNTGANPGGTATFNPGGGFLNSNSGMTPDPVNSQGSTGYDPNWAGR